MKILLIVDVPGWAWDHKANNIIKYLSCEYDISKIYLNQYNKKIIEPFDSVHSFSWDTAYDNINFITCGISSFTFKNTPDYKDRLKKFSGITAVSKELYNILKDENVNNNIYYCANGVDETKFFPNKKTYNKKFIIGWVAQTISHIKVKGYNNILLPLQHKLNIHKDIELRIMTNNYQNAINHNLMPCIYNEMDLYICTSLLEGTPNPVFEAAACGKPIISTSVGTVPELIINNFNGILLPSCFDNKESYEKTVTLFYDNIIFLKNNLEKCREMGEKSREIIEKNWTWKQRARQWIPVFENHLYHNI